MYIIYNIVFCKINNNVTVINSDETDIYLPNAYDVAEAKSSINFTIFNYN